MAEISIDRFLFLTQWKAQASPGLIPKDRLAIWADYGSLLLAKSQTCFEREIKEDI
jgi:hypothetical protein